jgi:hypothetical protein
MSKDRNLQTAYLLCKPRVCLGTRITTIFSLHRKVPLVRSHVFELAYNEFQVCKSPEFSLGFINVVKEHICLSKVKDTSYPIYPNKDTVFPLTFRSLASYIQDGRKITL